MSGSLDLTLILKRPTNSNPFVLQRQADRLDVVSVLDEFSQSCFSSVVNLWPIDSHNFARDLEIIQPAFLLVESVWQGNEGRWRYMVARRSAASQQLGRLLSECRTLGIPSVFWNKEDPAHFSDFRASAEHFDYVFTTDGDIIPRYEHLRPGRPSKLLRFFAAPALHNPRQVDRSREGGIAFGGQYFRTKFPERREQMDLLFQAASDFPFAIFSRVLGGLPDYQFPDEYARFIQGSLPYAEMVNEYKRHKVFLNVNSVTDSSTMCARRIFELAACKTVVMSTPTAAITSVFAEDEIALVDSTEGARQAMEVLVTDDRFRRAMAQRAWRRVAERHTVHERLQIIADEVGIAWARGRTPVVVPVDADQTQPVARVLAEQSLLCRETEVLLWIVADDRYYEIGASGLRECPGPAGDRFIAHLRPDYSYGEHYLLDMYLTLDKFVWEPVVTKPFPEDAQESTVEHVRPGAWMGRDTDQSRELLRRSWSSDDVPVEFGSAYASDDFNFLPRRDQDLNRDGWCA